MGIEKILKSTTDKWKLKSYTGMYDHLIEATGINEKTLRDAIKHGVGTAETVSAINKFFTRSRKKQAA